MRKLFSRITLFFALALAASFSWAQGTWSADQMMGLNANPMDDGNKTWMYRNLAYQARAWCPTTPFDAQWCYQGDSYANTITLKGSSDPNEGYPAAGQNVNIVVATRLTNANAGTYLISVAGDNPPISVVTGTISSVVYDSGSNRTTATLTVPSGLNPNSDLISLRFNNVSSDFGDLRVMQPGYAVTDTVRFTNAAANHHERANVIRGMDRLKTNTSIDVNWNGSIAKNKNTLLGYRNSLKGVFDLASKADAHAWVNIPARASDSYISSFMADVAQYQKAGKITVVEFANEPWNSQFIAWQWLLDKALTTANVRMGKSDWPGKILSIVRAGGEVTITFDTAHGKAVGDWVYQKVDVTGQIAAGHYQLKTGTAGSVMKFNQAGANVTGSVNTAWYDSWVALTPTHELVAPLTTYGAPNEWPYPEAIKTRYEMTRLRVIYDAAVTLNIANRVRIVKGAYVAYPTWDIYGLAWAKERYGSLAWLNDMGGGLSTAHYLYLDTPASITSVDDVFTQLGASRVKQAKYLIQFSNIVRSLGQYTFNGYEGGPHTHDKVNDTIAGYIRTAHRDDSRMGTLLGDSWADWKNRGGGPLVFFHGGAVDTFGGLGNNTWALIEGTLTNYGNKVKDDWFTAQRTVSSVPVAVSGVTSGTIKAKDVYLAHSGAYDYNEQLILDQSAQHRSFTFLVTADTARSYTLSVDAATTLWGGGDSVELLVNGTSVASGTLQYKDLWTLGQYAGQALSTPVSLSAGQHIVEVRFGTTRGAAVGLYQLHLN